jgi:hypothetical protein
MGLPSKIKKNIPLTESKTLFARREELLEKINKDGTYLPKSLLHADLDRGFLDFVKNDLKVVVEGKTIPTVDILVTTQNWAQFTETWNFQNIDKNVEPPFITVVRTPEVKYGTNPAVVYNIPNRKQYFYAQVPTWDGQRNGMDIYTIPQPVPVDITYSVKIICNRMRELNKLNQIILEKFASKQAYTVIKGHYIPIVMGGITDESVFDVEKRKYYIQTYEFTMLGFLIDEDEFEVAPAITRVLTSVEFDPNNTKRQKKITEESKSFQTDVLFVVGNNTLSQKINYTVDVNIGNVINVESFDVFINDDYYGSDLTLIQINTNDILRIDVVKKDNNKESTIQLLDLLL